MKKSLVILSLASMILFSCLIVSATPESDFVSNVIDNPSNFEIVIGNLSTREIAAVTDLSDLSGIPLYSDYDEEGYTDNFIIVGSSDKNTKVDELGDSSMGNFYVLGTNLFIVGSPEENIIKINEIITEIQNYNSDSEENGGDSVDESDSSSQDDETASDDTTFADSSQEEEANTEDVSQNTDSQTDTPTSERIVDDSGTKIWKSSTVIPAVILGSIALGIIIVFVVSFLRRPN
jgi:hypothetical protein